MLLTLILSLVMMAGLFLMLLSGVGFIQDRRFFTSAPKEVQAAVKEKEERFAGQHLTGWIMAVLSIALMAGAIFQGGWDGIRNGFTFPQFFGRFAVMLLLLKAFDILVFDWFLLCRSGFFPHFYPEFRPYLGPHLFGYNRKSHLLQTALLLAGSALLAWICTLL